MILKNEIIKNNFNKNCAPKLLFLNEKRRKKNTERFG